MDETRRITELENKVAAMQQALERLLELLQKIPALADEAIELKRIYLSF